MKAQKVPLPFVFDTFMRSVEFEYLQPVKLWTGVEHGVFIFTDPPGLLRVEVYDHNEQWTVVKSFTAPIPTTLREADQFHASCFTYYDDPQFLEDGEYNPEREYRNTERAYRRQYELEHKRRDKQQNRSQGVQ